MPCAPDVTRAGIQLMKGMMKYWNTEIMKEWLADDRILEWSNNQEGRMNAATGQK
jgi:hypothetical protein